MTKNEYIADLFDDYNRGYITADEFDYYLEHCEEIFDFDEDEEK